MVIASIIYPPILNNYVQSFYPKYKDILGYNGAYCVGFDGSVWSRWVRVGFGKHIIGTDQDWIQLGLRLDSKGYPQVLLCINGKQTDFMVHKLVTHYFMGPCPVGLEVCHEDGDSGNPCLCNLRYDTHQSNNEDTLKHGTHQRGELSHAAFLTWDAVDKMRAEFAAGGVTKTALAAKYNTDHKNVRDIINNKRWVRPW